MSIKWAIKFDVSLKYSMKITSSKISLSFWFSQNFITSTFANCKLDYGRIWYVIKLFFENIKSLI